MMHAPIVLLIGALQLTPTQTVITPGITLAAEDAPGSAVTESPHSARLIAVHRTLRYTTMGSLLVTGALGTLTSINKGTAIYDGRCETGTDVIFGLAYGCNSLNIVHGASAVISTVLYTATAATGWVLGDIDTAERDRSQVGLPRKIVGWIHLVGMVLQPLLGIVSAYPEVIGVPPDHRQQFAKDLRTVHVGIGYVTIVAYGAAIVMDW